MVENVIESWWSWQDGVDFEEVRASGRISAARLSPGILMIQSLEIVLQSNLDGMDGYEDYRRDVFPVCGTGDGGYLCIAKDGLNRQWAMCYLPKEKEGWIPICTEWNARQPTFSQYVDRLANAIRDRHVVANSNGAMVGSGGNPVVCYPFFRD